MMPRRWDRIIVVCSWAAILAWIQCGALAFEASRTPTLCLTPPHQVNSRAPYSNIKNPRYSNSVRLSYWLHAEDDVGVVANLDNDQDDAELAQRMEKLRTATKDHSSDASKVTQTRDGSTTIRTRDQGKPHRRRQGFGMPGGSGATSDGLRFAASSCANSNKTTTQTGSSKDETVHRTNAQEQTSLRWYVTLDETTGLQVPLNLSIAAKKPINKTMESRVKAEAAFRIKLVDDDTSPTNPNAKKSAKQQCQDKRTRQLASLLGIPISSAQAMVRRAPSLADMDVTGTLRKRCVEISLLLQCSPSRFVSVVRRCPTLLTFRVDTICTKLVQLDRLLSGKLLDNRSNATLHVLSNNAELVSWVHLVSMPGQYESGARWNDSAHLNVDVSESTLSIARRVPLLLASNVDKTLATRSIRLRELLFDESGNGSSDGRQIDEAFARVLKRCPELLLYNIKETIEPKLFELTSLLARHCAGLSTNHDEKMLGRATVLREPRLLLYNINKSLLPKVLAWKVRTKDEQAFTELLARYPTLLMYSLGAAARLDYFSYRNERKPDASEARQLLMLSKKAIETWGEDQSECSFDSTPAILGGTISKRGRPRSGETAVEASRRRGTRQAAQLPYLPNRLEYQKVSELRNLLREYGGVPASKLKSQLVSEIRELCNNPNVNNDMRPVQTTSSSESTTSITKRCLSYSQWITMKLCTCYPQHFEASDEAVPRTRCKMKSVGELEKSYGMALKGSIKAQQDNAVVDVVEKILR